MQTASADGWPAAMAFGDTTWKDYNLSLEVKSLSGGDDGQVIVSVNVVDENDFRALSLGDQSRGDHRLVHIQHGASRHQPQVHPGKFLERDTWYKVVIEVRGTWCRCTLDGEKLFEDTDNDCGPGRIALATWGSAARFRRIEVKSPDGKELWSGLPSGLPTRPPLGAPPAADGSKTQTPSVADHSEPPQSGQPLRGNAPVGRQADSPGSAEQHRREPAGQWTQGRFPEVVEVTGKWTKDGDELMGIADGDSHPFLLFGDPKWSNYDFSASVQKLKGDKAIWVVFNAQDARNRRTLFLGSRYNTLHATHATVQGRPDRTNSNAQWASLEDGTWYRVQLRVRGANCEYWLDDVKLFDQIDSQFASGLVGFGAGKRLASKTSRLRPRTARQSSGKASPSCPVRSRPASFRSLTARI